MSSRLRMQRKPPKTLPRLEISLNREQKEAQKLFEENVITMINGLAGSGKTLCAIHYALNRLHSCQINKIFITRPLVEAGERVGFLPGELEDKVNPFMQPIYDNLLKLYSKKEEKDGGRTIVEKYLETGELEIAPVGFMRGRTFSDCVVVLDEAQNTTIEQMKMALTRIGKNGKLIICGDLNQCDLKGHSGFEYVINIHRLGIVNKLEKIHLKENHRDPIVAQLLNAFSQIDKLISSNGSNNGVKPFLLSKKSI